MGDDGNNGPDQFDTEEALGPHVELIRAVDRTKHVSPTDTKKEVDFVVRNPSDQEFNFLFLPLREFARDLKVEDENGWRLDIYSNSEVKEMLEAAKEDRPEAYEAFQHRFKHAEYKLFIQLPPERPLGPGEMRTISLIYEQSEAVDFYGLTDPKLHRGWINQWRKKFFRIPSFVAGVERFPGHPHDVFINVVGTPGYGATGTSELDGKEPESEIYENGLDDDTRILSVRLPQAVDKRYEWSMQYDLIPNNDGLMKSLVWYWILAIIAGVGSVSIAVLGSFSDVAVIGQTISAGFITATIGLVFALTQDWASRYRFMSVVPLLIHGLAWLLWKLQAPPPT